MLDDEATPAARTKHLHCAPMLAVGGLESIAFEFARCRSQRQMDDAGNAGRTGVGGT
jgi:hypothetical protein